MPGEFLARDLAAVLSRDEEFASRITIGAASVPCIFDAEAQLFDVSGVSVSSHHPQAICRSGTDPRTQVRDDADADVLVGKGMPVIDATGRQFTVASPPETDETGTTTLRLYRG